MSLERYQLRKSSYREARKSIKFQQNQLNPSQKIQQPNDQSSSNSSEYHDKVPSPQPAPAPKPKKKRIKKQEQNQGIRIAKQKKIQYIFRNICNPNGQITLESLGHTLAKYQIKFTVSELQRMIAVAEICSSQENERDEGRGEGGRRGRRSSSRHRGREQGEQGEGDREGDREDSQSQRSESSHDILSFSDNQIREDIRNSKIKYQAFRNFYISKF